MEIKVKRIAKRETYTIGRMYVNGEYYCDTLEDKDRGLTQDMPLAEIRGIKVYGETAIPAGHYRVTSASWSKYGVNVPLINDVPGFTGILIHNGRTAAHTSGCIIVGENRAVGQVFNGKKYMTELNDMVMTAIVKGEQVTIDII